MMLTENLECASQDMQCVQEVDEVLFKMWSERTSGWSVLNAKIMSGGGSASIGCLLPRLWLGVAFAAAAPNAIDKCLEAVERSG